MTGTAGRGPGQVAGPTCFRVFFRAARMAAPPMPWPTHHGPKQMTPKHVAPTPYDGEMCPASIYERFARGGAQALESGMEGDTAATQPSTVLEPHTGDCHRPRRDGSVGAALDAHHQPPEWWTGAKHFPSASVVVSSNPPERQILKVCSVNGIPCAGASSTKARQRCCKFTGDHR